jgi:hypothetical protein
MKKLLLLILLLYSVCELTAQSFTGSFDLVMTQLYQNGNTRKDTVTYHFDTDRTAMVIPGRRNDPDMRMIFDKADSTITNLFEMNNRKGGYVLPMDLAHWPGMPQAMRPLSSENSEEMLFTGKEKRIEGYACRQAAAENDEYDAILWVTDEIPLSMTHVLSYQSVGKGKSKKEIELFDQMGITGLPLEMQLINKSEGADVMVEIHNISTSIDPEVFNTEGHELSRIKN